MFFLCFYEHSMHPDSPLVTSSSGLSCHDYSIPTPFLAPQLAIPTDLSWILPPFGLDVVRATVQLTNKPMSDQHQVEFFGSFARIRGN